MIISEVLLSIASSAGYDKLFKDENASIISGKLEHYLDKTTEEFFRKHNQYGYDHDSFLANENNVSLILKSMFYGEEIDLINEIDRRGFNDNSEISKEHLEEFLTLFYKNCKSDFELADIMYDKNFKRNTSNSLEYLEKGMDRLLKQQKVSETEKVGWTAYDERTNESMNILERKKYNINHENGLSQTFKINGDVISYKQTTLSGEKIYADVDMETGTAFNIKPPFPWEEYSIVYDEDEVIHKTRTTNWEDGSYEEKIIFEFQRECTAYYNSEGKLIGINASGGWSIIHEERKITPLDI